MCPMKKRKKVQTTSERRSSRSIRSNHRLEKWMWELTVSPRTLIQMKNQTGLKWSARRFPSWRSLKPDPAARREPVRPITRVLQEFPCSSQLAVEKLSERASFAIFAASFSKRLQTSRSPWLANASQVFCVKQVVNQRGPIRDSSRWEGEAPAEPQASSECRMTLAVRQEPHPPVTLKYHSRLRPFRRPLKRSPKAITI
ncbi:MAG: hypothetical protein JWN70_2164 [Planctomycetaceae bacterium]|nr:hypothetical protein [Planctomycetaceae bacterium]